MQLSTLASWPALTLANTSDARLFRRVDGNPQGLTEAAADHRLAADALRGLVTTTATVRRRARAGAPPTVREVPVTDLVVGEPVLIVFAIAVLFGLSIVFTPAAAVLQLHPLPLAYLPWLTVIVTAYCACVRCAKARLNFR